MPTSTTCSGWPRKSSRRSDESSPRGLSDLLTPRRRLDVQRYRLQRHRPGRPGHLWRLVLSQSVFGYAGVPFLEDQSEFDTRQVRTQTPVWSTPEREVHDLAVEMNLVGVLVPARITVGAAITEH